MSHNGITFHFSSLFNLERFCSRIVSHETKINEMLSNKYKFNIKCDSIADLSLYMDIEKRGFLLTLESGEKVCRENLSLVLNGEIRTKRN